MERADLHAIPANLPRAELMARILERDGGSCVWCSVPLAIGDRLLTFEHVVPVTCRVVP